MLYTLPWSRFELTTSVVIGTDCIGGCKSNCHMITATTAPPRIWEIILLPKIKCLCNQCLSPLMLWVRISIRARYTTLCDKVCQWLATGLWFSPGPTVSPTNKTDCHNITEILLKVVLNTINQTNKFLATKLNQCIGIFSHKDPQTCHKINL
jgi:hypothetical protein